ncbi:MAG TPA: anti-anti-sigma factor [Lentisphaeria bacterium]|nr:MAG: hypothetical protein A2X47_01140 [Lentisphaerae bacterium GWF2_38_69]HBM17461.1 anti-anti-sigma factor [Lentisphaeria bacterium]
MKVTSENNVKCILLPSKFDTAAAMDIETCCMNCIKDGTNKVLCDFSKTEYISSFGLRIILSLAKKLQKTGGQIVLSSMSPSIFGIFKVSGFDKIFKIYETKELALKSL